MSFDQPHASTRTQFHPKYDREVFTVVFSVIFITFPMITPLIFPQVQGYGFKTDAALLCMHSEVVRDMLDARNHGSGGGFGLPAEGTIAMPLEVEGCTPETFANFMAWLHHA